MKEGTLCDSAILGILNGILAFDNGGKGEGEGEREQRQWYWYWWWRIEWNRMERFLVLPMLSSLICIFISYFIFSWLLDFPWNAEATTDAKAPKPIWKCNAAGTGTVERWWVMGEKKLEKQETYETWGRKENSSFILFLYLYVYLDDRSIYPMRHHNAYVFHLPVRPREAFRVSRHEKGELERKRRQYLVYLY